MIKTSVLLPFGKTIFQYTSGQAISSDTAFLVETILTSCKADNQNVLELGSGNGIISIMLSHYRPNWKIVGIEIQPELVELSKENAALSETNVNFQYADLRIFSNSNRFDPMIFAFTLFSITNLSDEKTLFS